jgi:hypothetical protein
MMWQYSGSSSKDIYANINSNLDVGDIVLSDGYAIYSETILSLWLTVIDSGTRPLPGFDSQLIFNEIIQGTGNSGFTLPVSLSYYGLPVEYNGSFSLTVEQRLLVSRTASTSVPEPPITLMMIVGLISIIIVRTGKAQPYNP